MTTLGAIRDAGAWTVAFGATSLPAYHADVLLKALDPNEFLHQVMQTLALFSGVAMILIV